MTAILAIDAGSTRSAWLVLDGSRIHPDELGDPLAGITPNTDVCEMLRGWHAEARLGDVPFLDALVIENIEPRYGTTVGWETLDTARWVGRFQEAAHPLPVTLLKRSDILRHLGVDSRGKKADSGVRMALLDRWGGKEAAIGRKAAQGPLYGVKADLWAALAVAATFTDMRAAA